MNTYTILIVDDEEDIRELLKYNLNQNGYNTVLAHDGMDALIKIDSKIDLVLLDLMMPNLDGYQTCQKIRENLTTKNIPIIFKVRCIQRPIRTFYICYNCSQNQRMMYYNFGNEAAQFLKEQNNTYPNFE